MTRPLHLEMSDDDCYRECPACGAPLAFDGSFEICTDDDCSFVDL